MTNVSFVNKYYWKTILSPVHASGETVMLTDWWIMRNLPLSYSKAAGAQSFLKKWRKIKDLYHKCLVEK